MSGNVYKSDAGWVRLRARIQAGGLRQSVRSSSMEHRVDKQVVEPVAPKVRKGRDSAESIVVNGRRRRRAFVAHNGRY